MKWFRVSATREQLDNLIAFAVSNIEADVKVPGKFLMEIRLICEELLVNIIDYSYPDKQGDVELGYDYDSDEGCVTLMFIDHGVEFNPTMVKDPDLTEDIMERKIGGLGIYMVKQLSESVKYERQDDANVLTIKKKTVTK